MQGLLWKRGENKGGLKRYHEKLIPIPAIQKEIFFKKRGEVLHCQI